jgi:hypothetical protein
MILLSQSLDKMNTRDFKGIPVPFSLVFSTADEAKGTGGEIIILKKAVLGKLLRTAPQADKIKETLSDKKPQQRANSIKRIFDLETERYYTVSIRLMWQFNNKEICW